MRLPTALSLLCLFLPGTAVVAQAPPTQAPPAEGPLADALARHESGIAQTQLFHVILHVFSPRPPNRDNFETWAKDAAEPVLYFECAWALDGTAERIKVIPHEQTTNDRGQPMNMDDYLRDGRREYWLANWDWDAPREITPTNQDGVSGEIRPQTSEFRARDPAMWLLRMPRFGTPEPRGTLREFVARFGDVSVDPPDAPDEAFVITLRNDRLEHIPKDSTVEVHLDPRADYHIGRLIQSSEKKGGERLEYAVAKFMKTPSGGFFPEEVRYTVTDAYLPAGVVMGIYRVVKSTFDEPLDPTLFRFRFPENAQVVDVSGGGDGRKWQLWGDENVPKADLKNPMDLLDYDPVAKATMAGERRPPWALLLAANGAVLALVLLFLWYRRRATR